MPIQIGRGLESLEKAGLCRPRTLTVAVTGQCNLCCTHCWVESGSHGSGPVPPDAVWALVAGFSRLGGQEVCLTGGEILTHPSWPAIVEGCCGQAGIRHVRLQTNATMITAGAAHALAQWTAAEVSVQVSLEGVSPETHDRVRGGGSFHAAARGIRALVDAGLGPRTTVAFTETRDNIGELPALFAWVEELGLGGVTSASVVACGRAATQPVAGPPTAEQYHSLAERYERDDAFRAGVRTRGVVAALCWRDHGGPRVPRACTFVENPYVTHTGITYPCVLYHDPGNGVPGAFDLPWEEILSAGAAPWGQLRALSLERSASLPACRGCGIHEVCRGGCMGRALAVHGDPMTPEDRCELRRAVVSARGSPGDG